MTLSLRHSLPAVQGPTAGGRSWGLGDHFMVPSTATTVRFCTVAKAPARHAKGVPSMDGAPSVRRAVGRCAAARRRALSPRKGVTVARAA